MQHQQRLRNKRHVLDVLLPPSQRAPGLLQGQRLDHGRWQRRRGRGSGGSSGGGGGTCRHALCRRGQGAREAPRQLRAHFQEAADAGVDRLPDVAAPLRLDRAAVRGVQRPQRAAVAQQQRAQLGAAARLRWPLRRLVAWRPRPPALLVAQQALELLDAVAPQLVVGALLLLLLFWGCRGGNFWGVGGQQSVFLLFCVPDRAVGHPSLRARLSPPKDALFRSLSVPPSQARHRRRDNRRGLARARGAGAAAWRRVSRGARPSKAPPPFPAPSRVRRSSRVFRGVFTKKSFDRASLRPAGRRRRVRARERTRGKMVVLWTVLRGRPVFC
jgi:hypothetical protein